MDYQEKDFTFSYINGSKRDTLKVAIRIPLDYSATEFALRLINAHKIPCYVESRLISELNDFVSFNTHQFCDSKNIELINSLKNNDFSVNDVVSKLTKKYTEEVAEYAKPDIKSNEVVFGEIYHSLIHSNALENLLNLEHMYALKVEQVINRRNDDLRHLESRQTIERDHHLNNLGHLFTDDQVNQLTQRHFDNTTMTESKWASELSNLKETQKREYRDWLMNVSENYQTNEADKFMQRVRAFSNMSHITEDSDVNIERLEESFTIHLGAQLKTVHNLRLISADVLDLCKHKPNKVGDQLIPQPQRLQTAMSLYSNSLCGMVLFVDNRLNSYSGIKLDFAKVCELSTDFHFVDLQQQLEVIRICLSQRDSEKNNQQLYKDYESKGNGLFDTDEYLTKMDTGDIYITRHSNLSEVHVVFHLVVDESIRSSEINSRNQIILGYRNILKACFTYDIHTITLPLLMVHEMSDEMTIPWCLKRAELMFKCIKGFIMEFAQWHGQQSRTIQFLVPKGISEEAFMAISNMLPTIFRLSNPVVVKSMNE